MKKYTIGLYEKAMPEKLSIKEKLQCAKNNNYDYMELSIDASEGKISRVYMSKQEREQIIADMLEVGISIDSLCVSALTKYALGDLDETKSSRGLDIIKNAIKLAYDLGVRIIMIPGYDIYFGESNDKTKAKYIENLKIVAEEASKYGVVVGFETMENEFMNTATKAMEYVHILNSQFIAVYPDCGNITNAIKTYNIDFREDLKSANGKLISMHLKETIPNVYREVPYGTGHVNFNEVIDSAWEFGIRKFVTEFWDTGKENWHEDIVFANNMMRNLLDKK